MGCGITAYDEEDAKRMLHERVFAIYPPCEIREVIVDVDVTTLEKNHVRPNMGPPALRGVWFPWLNSDFSAQR
jgi:hypothetical protein